MKEKNIQSLWFKFYRPFKTENHELKLVNLAKHKSFRFNSVSDHQVDSLLTAEMNILHYKIPDMTSMGGFSSPKPFDCTFWVNVSGFVVVVFYEPNKRKTAYKIPIKKFVAIKDNWKRKSIKEDELGGFAGIEIIEI